jgi:hypothetical protein
MINECAPSRTYFSAWWNGVESGEKRGHITFLEPLQDLEVEVGLMKRKGILDLMPF